MSKGLCLHLAYLFREVAFLERFGLAAATGFAGVEFSEPRQAAKEAIAERLEKSGLELVQFTTSSFATPERKQVGLAAVPGRSDDFRRDCEALVPYVELLRPKYVHAMAGIIEDGSSFNTCYETYQKNIRFAHDAFKSVGTGILIEPINSVDVPGYFMHEIALCARAIDDMGLPNVAIMFDAYHLARSGHDPVTSFQSFFDKISHVQIADSPGRHEPGTGRIAYQDLFDAIGGSGYGGWISCEYFPEGDTRKGLAWTRGISSKRYDLSGIARLVATTGGEDGAKV